MTPNTSSILSDAAPSWGASCTVAEKLAKPAPLPYKKTQNAHVDPTDCRAAPHRAALERLEPCEAKVSRTVLRGV
jgi:hypothetical protein